MMRREFNWLNICTFFCLSGWLILLFTQIFLSKRASGVSELCDKFEIMIHIIIFIVLFDIYKNITPLKDRAIFNWFIVTNVFFFINDLVFYIAVHAPGESFLDFSLLNFVPRYVTFFAWIFAIIVFLSKILTNSVLNKRLFYRIFISFILFDIIIIGLFLAHAQHVRSLLFWQNIVRIMGLGAELIVFDCLILCLIYSANIGISLISAGFIILISGSAFIMYSFLSQLEVFLGYGDLLWLLGMILILIGLLTIRKNKNYSIIKWFRETTAIKSILAFWAFMFSIVSFLILFIIADSFSIINSHAFAGTPFFLMVYSTIVVGFTIFLGKIFEAPFIKLMSLTENLKNDIYDAKYTFNIEEFKYLQDTIINSFKYKADIDSIKNKFGRLVAEVAHDLKSPVTALNLTLKKIENHQNKLDENTVKDLFLATRDITNISSSILSDYYQITDDEDKNTSIFKDDGNYPRFIILPKLVESLVTRKQTEFGNNINIKFQCDKWFYDNICQISPTKLIRNISNIINNSFQSCKGNDCVVTVCINKKSDTIEIMISDNGCGISADKLNDIVSIGDSSKHKGRGLGIISCIKYLEEINGKFKINSEVNVGTKVILEIPLIANPEWFIQKIIFEKNQKFVAIDDDSQIILKWQNIFSRLGVPAFYFLSSATFLEWFGNNAAMSIIIFSDYDLKDGTNGYDLLNGITKLEKSQFILTTDHAEEEWLQKSIASQNKIKLIPKELLTHLCIQRL